MRQHFIRMIWVVLLALSGHTSFVRVAYSQVNVAGLNGTITDASGAVVPNARVEVVSPDTGFKRQVETGDAGVYSITDLPIGTYDVTISHEGFKAFKVKGMQLFVGQTRTLDARLEVGLATATVEVKGTAQGLETTNAQVGVVMEHQQLADIPLNGRNWVLLATLAPGALTSDGTAYNLHFVGHGRDDNNFTFDGIDATGIQEQSQKADARLNISLDSIAEFRVNTSDYTADSGSSGGGQVNAVSKTGTNAFHGDLFEFLRNDKFDARSDFDPAHIPPFRMNQFGGSLGGPIRKDRTFFFGGYEGIRQSLTTTLIGFVPNATYRAQVLATSPALAPLLAGWPTGGNQTPVDAVTNEYISPGRNPIRENSFTFRVDHKFNENTSLYVRGNTDGVENDTPADNLGSRSKETIRPSNLVFQLSHVFSPSVVNEAKFGINRSAFHHSVIGTAPVGVSVPGFDGLSMNSIDLEVGTTISGIDNLTVVKGRHTFKMGGEIRRVRLNNTGEGLTSTSLSYVSQDLLVNNSLDSIYVGGALSEGGMRRTLIMGYGQDEFKASPNLTLNLGVRYELYTVVHEAFGRQAVVSFACGGFCPPGTPAYYPDIDNFAPRLGLAWSPGGGKTVIRTGFGMYYSANQMDDFSDIHESTAADYALSSADVPGGLSYPITPFLPLLAAQGASPKGIDRNRADGYYENWDFMVQRELPHSFIAQVGYVGGEGHRIWGARRVNLIDPLTGTRPLAGFGEFQIKYNNSNVNFHALQASLERHLTSGWLWQTQYQWSHTIADGTSGTGDWAGSWGGGGAGSGFAENMACIPCSRSNSAYDVRQTLSMNSVYELPFGPGKRFLQGGGHTGKLLGGWELSGIATARSGLPIDIRVSRSASDMLDGMDMFQRPDLVPGVPIYPAHQTINNWLNIAAFAVPAKDTWGNLGRNAAFGPGAFEIDTALEKRTSITERLAVKFRVEAFNLLNHPILASPSSLDITAPASFGVITSPLNTGATGTGTPRRIQFMLRLEF